MLFSIIVPVYNVEQYLKKCIDSILIQNFTDYELILVDDGSTDNSGIICDEYAKEDDRIIVIHQKNGGLSCARNAGLKIVRGEYIIFIDSDDWISKEALKQFADILDKHRVDILVGKAKTAYKNGTIEDKIQYLIPEGEYSNKEYMNLLLKTNSYSACAQFTICSSDFIKKNQLSFIKGLIHEDEVWTPNVLIKAQSVYVSDVFFYYHFCRDGSINRSNDENRSGTNRLKVVKELLSLLSSVPEKEARIIREQMVILYLQAICQVNRMTDDYLNPYIIRKNSYTLRTKIKSLLYTVSPKLYVLIHKIYRG